MIVVKIISQFITFAFIGYWPTVFLTSYILTGRGMVNKPSTLLLLGCMLFYPIAFGLFFYILQWEFLFIPPKYFLMATVALTVVGAFIFGYPKYVFDAMRGISSKGYYYKHNIVYYNGSKIPSADSVTFHEFKFDYARDKERVYYLGKPLLSVDVETFEVLPNVDPKTRGEAKDKNGFYFRGDLVKPNT